MAVGFAGHSDGWQDLARIFRLTWDYTRAENGNVALTAEIDLEACGGEFVLALGFGGIWSEAGQQVRRACSNLRRASHHYVAQWENWHKSLMGLDREPLEHDLYRASIAVLRTHESKDFLGGVIASLSIPWGFNKGDEDLGGYHLVWPRDLVETAFGFLAAGAKPTRCACFVTSNPRRRPMGIGPRTCGWTAVRTGTDCKWMRRHFPCCWWIVCVVMSIASWAIFTAGGHGSSSSGLPRPQWPRDAARSMGRGCRLFAVHAGRRNCRAARGRGYGECNRTRTGDR